MQRIQHPKNGEFKMPAWPVRFGGEAPPVKPAPMLGEHNADVLTGWLGLSASEVAGLKDDGVI